MRVEDDDEGGMKGIDRADRDPDVVG